VSSTLTPLTASVAPSVANLPAQSISTEVLIEKYSKGEEQTIADVNHRVARAFVAG
jgi:ribonucleoside-diphosphate reductase alpha chain